jgi:hypothetical protein
MTLQTIQFESVSLAEVGSGTLTAFLFFGATLEATLADITENATLRGRYTGTVTSIAAGGYRLVVKYNGITISEPNEAVTLALAVGTYVATQAVELDSSAQSMVTAFNVMRSGNVFTAPALANAPTGGGDNQEVLEAIADVTSAVAAYAARIALEVQLKGFPSVLCRNADYLEEVESEIRLTLEDVAGQEITEIAGTPVASLSWLFGAGTQTEPNLFDGTCSWDDDTDELVIEIPASETNGKKLGSLTWQVGVTISEKTRWLGGGTTRLIERQF